MWDLIVSVPDYCLSFYFVNYSKANMKLICQKHKKGTFSIPV